MTAPSTLPLPASDSAAPTITTRRSDRFTIDGDARLESHLANTCARIAAGIRGLIPRHELQAVVLGGGYGRGEGGVLRSEGGDQPYNDLEFYVFIRGNRHVNEWRYGKALHVLGEILTPQAGLDVEFRITSERELARSGTSMFSYDLISGHRWLVRDPALFQRCQHHRAADAIPPAEATRLLMNRCTGLLLAAERLRRPTFTPGDADFVARNIAKAQLGVGDAILAAQGRYHWSVQERHRRLEELARTEPAPWLADVCLHHSIGVRFKLHPFRSDASREQLYADHAHVTDFCRTAWLWLESRRLGVKLRTLRDYIDLPQKWPESSPLHSALVNAKQLGPKSLLAEERFRHPRERVLTTLPILLWQLSVGREYDVPAAVNLGENGQVKTGGSDRGQHRVQHELQTSATGFADLVAAYRRIWERVN